MSPLQGVIAAAALVLAGCVPSLDRDPPCLETGPRPDRGPAFVDAATDLRRDGVPADLGPDLKTCTSSTECDDGLDCTGDTCQAGHCTNSLQSGFCLIAGQCVAGGAQQGGDPCVVCDPSSSTTAWTSRTCVKTLAGDGSHDDDDGPAASASFRDPTDVALGPGGELYVADSSNHRIRLVSGGQVSTLAGSTAGNLDGAALQARFNKPAGVWLGAAGAVHAADRGNNLVRVISGGTVSTLGSGTELAGPSGGAPGAAGEVLCADTFHHRVVQISSGVTNVAGVKAVAGHKDGAASTAQFFYPMSLAVDASGTIYVADTFNHVVRSISGGTVTTVAGTAQTPGFADGPAASAMFRFPRGIAIDGQGVLYIGDTENHRIRVVKNGQVTTLAGTGSQGHKDGLASAATFDWPWGLDVDGSGTVYVADSDNDRIRVITP